MKLFIIVLLSFNFISLGQSMYDGKTENAHDFVGGASSIHTVPSTTMIRHDRRSGSITSLRSISIGEIELESRESVEPIAEEEGSSDESFHSTQTEFAPQHMEDKHNELPEEAQHSPAQQEKAMYSLLERDVRNFAKKYPKVLKINARERVKMALEKEAKLHPELLPKLMVFGGGNLLQKLNNIVEHVKTTKPTHYLVFESKLFVRRLLAWRDEAKWLADLMLRSESIFIILTQIIRIASLQSDNLDLLVNVSIFQEHLKAIHEKGLEHKKTTPNRAVIVGAGPIGLYTAFEFFAAGINIVLVNDRPERYLRKRVVFLHTKWLMQLRFLLGTHFDTLFVGNDAPGKMEEGYNGAVSIADLEAAMLIRLVSLANFVENIDRMNAVRNNIERIELRYETAFKQVDQSTATDPNFYAVLATPENRSNPDQAVFNENLLQIKTAKLKKTWHISQGKAKNWALVELINEKLNGIKEEQPSAFQGTTRRTIPFKPGRDAVREWLTPDEMAKKMVKGKALEMKKLPRIPMDILVCAGGANDRIRDNYIGLPKLLAIPRHYVTAVVEKRNKFKDAFGKLITIDEVTAEALRPYIEEQQFDRLVKSSRLLGSVIQRKYKALHDLILNGLIEEGAWTPEGGQRYRMMKKGKKSEEFSLNGTRLPDSIGIRIVEGRRGLVIGASTPAALEQLFTDLEERKRTKINKILDALDEKAMSNCMALFSKLVNKFKGLSKINKEILAISQEFTELRQRFERKWLIAAFNYAHSIEKRHEPRTAFNVDASGKLSEKWHNALEHSSAEVQQKLYFDDAQTSSFLLRVQAPEQPVNLLKKSAYAQSTIATSSLLVMALGDALASPHFFSGSGMNIARMGVDDAAEFLHHSHPNYTNAVQLKLAKKLNRIKEKVQRDALRYLKALPMETGVEREKEETS